MEEVILNFGNTESRPLYLFAAQNKGAKDVILIIPAMGVSAKFYFKLAETLAGLGHHCVVCNHRGIGPGSIRPKRGVDFSYIDLINLDLKQIVNWIKEQYPNQKLFSLGHSLGGQLSALYCSIYPGDLSGLILIASCSVFYKGWSFPRNLGVLAGTQMAALIATMIGHFPGAKLGFGGYEAKSVIHDWARNARNGNYVLAGTNINFEQKMSGATIPVMAISLEGDHLAPYQAVKNLYQKLASSEITHHHLTEERIDPRALHHFNWAKYPEQLTPEIIRWINNQNQDKK